MITPVNPTRRAITVTGPKIEASAYTNERRLLRRLKEWCTATDFEAVNNSRIARFVGEEDSLRPFEAIESKVLESSAERVREALAALDQGGPWACLLELWPNQKKKWQ